MTESTPLAISSHSFSISLRSLIAPTICRSPVAIAQPAMNSSSTSAVMPGQAKVRIPTAMPNSHDEREPPAWRRGAAHDRLRERQHAVSEREGAVEQHQREQRYSRPDEGEDPEQDGADAAQEQQPPMFGEGVQQQTRQRWTSNVCHDRPPSVLRR